MKKQTILFLAGGLLALASCGGSNEGSKDNAQAKLDSMQNAMQMQQKEQAVKDSMAAAMNAEKAKSDSMAGAMKKEEESKMAGSKHHEAHKGEAKNTENVPQPSSPPAPTTNTNTGKNTGQDGTNLGKRH